MAHGLAALRQFKLVQYAQRFASAGYAVVLFDYRYWGGSTGRPRELVSINAQLDDWRTMIRHIQERKSIDSKRIVLWGTALSGGHVSDACSRSCLQIFRRRWYKFLLSMGLKVPNYILYSNSRKRLKFSSQDYMGAKVRYDTEDSYLWLTRQRVLFLCRRRTVMKAIYQLSIRIITGVVTFLHGHSLS